MSALVVIHCDAVHPERTPPQCRAYIATRATVVPVAYEEAWRAGWSQDVGNIDTCPSCSRGVS